MGQRPIMVQMPIPSVASVPHSNQGEDNSGYQDNMSISISGSSVTTNSPIQDTSLQHVPVSYETYSHTLSSSLEINIRSSSLLQGASS